MSIYDGIVTESLSASDAPAYTYTAASWNGVGQITFLVATASGQAGYVTFNQYRSSVSDALQVSDLNTTGTGLFYWEMLFDGIKPAAVLTPVSLLEGAVSDFPQVQDATLFGNPYWEYPRESVSFSSEIFRGIPTQVADTASIWSIMGGADVSQPAIMEALSVEDTLAYLWGLLALDGFAITDTPVGAYGKYVIGALSIGALSSPNSMSQLAVSENVRLRGAVLGALAIAVQEALNFGGSISLAWGVGIVGRLVASGIATSRLEAQQLVAAALSMLDDVSAGKGAFASSAFTLSGEFDPVVYADASVLAALILADTPQMTLQIFLEAESTALLIDPPSGSTPFGPQQLLDLVVAEQAILRIGYNAGDGTYTGWVVNTNTQAVSQYAGWAFNSFAQFYGQYLGASSVGLMELGGTQDGTAAIQATLQTAVTDFGSGHKKRVRSAYLGVAAEGTCYLQVLTDDNVERVYQLVPNAPGLSSQRVDLARGVQSRYWSFSLQSTDGSAWRLDNLEVLPVVLPRRV